MSPHVIFPDWVSEIHTAQSQWLIQRQRIRISNILSLYFILITTLIHGSKDTRYSIIDRTRALLESNSLPK